MYRMSSNGFQTPVWGPPAWFFLHTITFNYPLKPTKKQKQHYLKLFTVLRHTLPCRACRESYCHITTTGNTKLTMRELSSRRTLSLWLYRVHKRVNKRIGLPNGPDYNTIEEFYEKLRATCSKGPKVHGCTQPTRGIKKRTIIYVVPRNCKKRNSIQLHQMCKK